MIRYIFLSVLTIALFSCKHDTAADCTDETPAAEKIRGTWTITENFNPWTQTSDTSTAGTNKELTFQADGTLIMRDPATGTTENSTWDLNADDNGWVQVGNGNYYPTITCDQLILDSTPVDGPRLTYRRK